MKASVLILTLLAGCAPASANRAAADRVTDTRAELERWYAENSEAFQRWDLQAIMALKAPDFHSVTPDGVTHDRAEAVMLGTRILRMSAANATIISDDTVSLSTSERTDKDKVRAEQHRIFRET